MTDHKTDEANGPAKEATGATTNDEELKSEGRADTPASTSKGQVKDAVDTVKGKLAGKD